MELNEQQKKYLKTQFYRTGGSENTILKADLSDFAKSLGLEIKKHITKDSILNLIYNTGNEDKLLERFGKAIDVSYYDAARLNCISYKQLSDLEQLEVITALEYKGYKDSTLYPISILGFKPGELLEIWNNKNKTDFHRTRIDIKDAAEIEPIVSQISKAFEVENVSKPYPHREFSGYYIYLSIRSLDAAVTNDNFKNQENAKLKLENSTLKAKVEELNTTINIIGNDARQTEVYKSLKDRLADAEISEYKVKHLEYLNEKYTKQIAELEEKLKAPSNSGRPSKFTSQEEETMKMYRLQGMSIRMIAKSFDCSTGLVHKIINKE